MATTFELKDHQREALDWLVNIENNVAPYGGILADDMGLGKTLESLSVVKANPLPHTLVIVPASLVEQWVIEIDRFAHGLEINIDVPGSDITVTSFYKASHRRDILEFKWDRIILDEGHFIRNPKTKTYKGLKELKAKHRWVLTGTPIQNKIKDLITLMRFINIDVSYKKTEELKHTIETYVLRRTKQNVGIKMPGLKVFKHYIDFDTEKDKEYYELIDKSKQEAIVKLMRLRQFTLLPKMVPKKSFISKKDEEKEEEEEDIEEEEFELTNTKLNAVVRCIKKNSETQKPLVFCHFKKEMSYLEEKLKENGYKIGKIDGDVPQSKRTQIIANHQKIDVLLIQLMAGSTGLNLQMFNSVIFTAPHWNPTHEQQAVCRAFRIGQTRDVAVHRFVIKDTLEQHIVDLQKFKQGLAKKFGFEDNNLSEE